MGILIFMANLFGFYGDFIVINGTVYDDSWYCLWWLTENFWDWIKTYGDTIKICMQQKWWRCDGGIIGISTCNYCNEIWVGHGLYRCTLQLTILRRTIKKWWSVGIGLAKGVVFCENGIFLTDFFLPKLQKLCLQIHDWYVTIINIHARSCVTFSVG